VVEHLTDNPKSKGSEPATGTRREKISEKQINCRVFEKRKRISHKQSAGWQHLSWLKASAFISLQKN
jgi:hypothetical protein